MSKLCVIGMDGATWKLLAPLADAGIMPTLARLRREGITGNLASTMPAMTAPSWTTFATGKHPGKHGVFDFMLPTTSLGKMKLATGADIRDWTFYELLHQHGLTPILVNLPGSYPPKLHDTITITSLLTQGDQWIFPSTLIKEIPELSRYRLTPNESLRLKERREEYIEDLLRHMDDQMSGVQRLFTEKPWDFFFYLFSHSDWVSHLAFTDLTENHDPSPTRVFARIDYYLEWFENHLPKDCDLIIVSDHGFASYKKIFYFNRWLEQEGYLVTNTAGDQFRGAATRRAKETDRIQGKKQSVRIPNVVFRILSSSTTIEHLAKWMYHHIVKPYIPVNIKVNVGIDFTKTKVCFPKGSYITNAYINKAWVYEDGIVTKEEYLNLRNEVVAKMRAIHDDEGNPVIARVLVREEVYGNNAPEEAPDIFFELSDYWLVGQFHSGKLFGREIQNKHDAQGIFLAKGPSFRVQETVQHLRMEDITPLILHLFHIPVPNDVDGHVPTQCFAPQSNAAKQALQFGDSSRRTPSTHEHTRLHDAITHVAQNLR